MVAGCILRSPSEVTEGGTEPVVARGREMLRAVCVGSRHSNAPESRFPSLSLFLSLLLSFLLSLSFSRSFVLRVPHLVRGSDLLVSRDGVVRQRSGRVVYTRSTVPLLRVSPSRERGGGGGRRGPSTARTICFDLARVNGRDLGGISLASRSTRFFIKRTGATDAASAFFDDIQVIGIRDT